MKATTFIILMMSMGLAFLGCTEKSKDDIGQTRDKANKTMESVKNEIKVSKTEFVNNVEEELAAMESEMDTIKQKISKETGESKSKLKKQWQQMQDQKEVLENDLQELKATSSESWKDLKAGVNTRLDSLNNSFNDLKDELGINT